MAKIHWAHSANGTFALPANWNPAQIPGANDEADLDAGGAYTVTVNDVRTVQTLIIADASATLAVRASTATTTFTIGSGTSVNLGAINLDGASSSNPAQLISSAGDTLINGITGTINVNSNAQLVIQGTLQNFGTINLNSGFLASTVADHNLTGGGKVILAGGVITSDGNTLTNVDNSITGDGLIGNTFFSMALNNQGVIGATVANKSLKIDTGTTAIVNGGVMYASPGTLDLASPVSNNKAIAAVQGGVVLLDGSTVTNGAGGVLAAVQTGQITLAKGASIKGGSLVAASGGVFQIQQSSTGTFDGSSSPLSLTGDVNAAGGASLTLAGSINNTGSIILDSSSVATALKVRGNVTLAGAGSVKLQGSGPSEVISNGATATLTNQGGTFSGVGTIGDGNLSMVNTAGGLIMANQPNGVLTLSLPSSFKNAGGVLAAINGGVLKINQMTIANGATGVIVAAMPGSLIDLSAATIQGGQLITATGGAFNVSSGGVLLDGQTTQLINNATVPVQNGAILNLAGNIANIGTLTLNGGATLQVIADTTLLGTGNVQFTGSSQVTFFSGTTLTNAGNTISASNTSVNISGKLANQQGTIKAADGGSFQLQQDFSNAGIVEAAATTANGTAAIVVSSGSAHLNVINTGTMLALSSASAQSSGLQINDATITNQGGAIVSYGPHSFVFLTTVTLNGGAVVTAAGGALQSLGGGASGASTIHTTVQNFGSLGVFDAPLTIDALAGTGSVSVDGALHVTGDFSGGGSATLDGTTRAATLSVDGTTAAGLITFNNGSHTETLRLAHARQFSGAIAGFSASASAQLDLADVAFSGTPQPSWFQVATGTSPYGYLLVNGGNAGVFLMLGSFAQAGFHKAQDAGTGTTITYTPPPSPPAPPSASASSSATGTEQLVQMMASFGGDSSGMSGNGVTAPASSTTTSDWLALPAAHG